MTTPSSDAGDGSLTRADHVLLTRFSAVLVPGAPPAARAWLDYRMGFFYDACYPSVTGQREATFEWLILFDDRCDDDFRDLVDDLAKGAFTPVWSREPFRRNSFSAPVAAHLADREPASHLITTRIDSDDAMAVDFMAAVQRQFRGQDRLFVDFPRGIQIDRSGAVYRSDILASPFLSLIERRTSDLPDTVFVAKHARARAHGPIREVRAPVMWAQVVHGVNLSNIVNGVRVPPAVVAERFDFHLGYDADIAGMSLARARARHLGALTRLWAGHPGELTKYAEARAWTLRGTHERAQDDGGTLTDRVQRAELAYRRFWRASTLRAGLRAARESGRRARWRMTARVNARADPRPVHVCGDLGAVLSARRVVVLAEYSSGPALRADAVATARGYAAAGLAVLVVAAREPWRSVQPGEVGPMVAVVRRPNLGYDFGSWGAALMAYPQLAGKELVVLTNDSLLGPFGPLDDLVARMGDAPDGVWGATEHNRPHRYLQSYLLAFRGGILARDPLSGFFAGVRPQASKRDVVLTYEAGLSALLDRHGIGWSAEWSHRRLGLPEGADASIEGWGTLLQAGFPFVKRRLVEERHLRPLGEQALDYLARTYAWRPTATRNSRVRSWSNPRDGSRHRPGAFSDSW